MIFAAAAEEAKLEVVTKMAQWFTQPSHHSFFTREHWLTDQAMSWMPNVDVITVNPALFADNYFLVMAPIAQLGLMPLPLGDGLNAPPSNEDIARVAAATLADPAPHIGKSYRPTGPELLSPKDIAGIMAKALGRKVKYMDVPMGMFVKAGILQGYPAFQISQLRHYFEEHKRSALTVNAPNDVVREIGGREPEDFETIARRYAASHPDAVRTWGNKLKAIRFFARLMMMRTPDMDRYGRRQNHASIENAVYSSDSDEWLAAHAGQDEGKTVSLDAARKRVNAA